LCVQIDLVKSKGATKQINLKGGCFNNNTEVGIYTLAGSKSNDIRLEVRSSQDPFIAFASVKSASALESYYFWLSSGCLFITFMCVVALFLFYKLQI